MKEKFAIIVAGGKGLRMNADIPKQFLEVGGKPIVMRTIEKFTAIAGLHVLLVLPEGEVSHWTKLCEKHSFVKDIRIVIGGQTRFHSVKNGLDVIDATTGVVAVHDGVRPYVSPELIQKLLEEAERQGSAIPYTLPKESIRIVDADGNRAVNRTNYRMIQTPQCFDLENLKQAYLQPYSNTFTDDASVYEQAGHPIVLVEGEYGNVKITTSDDIKS